MTWRRPPHTRAGRVCHRVSWRPSEKSAAPPPQGDVHCVSFPGVADGVCGCSERPSPGALFPAGHCWGARGSPPPISPHALTNSSQLVVLLFPLNSFRKNITCFPRERPSRVLWEHRAPGRKHREVTSLWTAITLSEIGKRIYESQRKRPAPTAGSKRVSGVTSGPACEPPAGLGPGAEAGAARAGELARTCPWWCRPCPPACSSSPARGPGSRWRSCLLSRSSPLWPWRPPPRSGDSSWRC